MKDIKNFLIKREQSQACLSFAKREKSRLLAKIMITLVALIAVTTGAWADGKVINSEIDYESLKVGDILVEGFSISGLYSTKFYFNAGRAKKGETLLNEDVSFFKGYISSVGTNTVITLSADAGDAAGIYTPIDENGQVANAWIVTSSNAQGNSDFHLSGYTYVDPNAATGPEVAWDKAKKTGTFSMPAGNVELEPEYYPQAALTAAPTAINDVPATTDGAILKAGTVATIGSTEQAQGTVMYYVSPTALDDAALLALAADQWTADVPTAESLAQGQAYVYYYVRGNDSDTDDENFSDGDILAANALTVTIAAAPTYAVTFAEGTDADKWQASPAADVTKGQTVTVTYTGSKKVLGVKAEKKAAPAGPKTYTELKGGEVLQVGDILDFSDANVEYIFSSYSLSQSYGPYTVLRANITGEKPHLTVTPADDGEYYVIKDKDGDYSFRNKSLPATATSDGILITINSEDGNVRICSASVHEP